MKVLLFDTTQSYLTPGGKQVHAQKLYENLPKVGVDVEYAKWWDPNQTFDIIHFFGYNAPYLLNAIKRKNKKIVLTQVLDVQTNFSPLKKKLYSWWFKLLMYFPNRVRNKFDTTSLNQYDALVYMHKFDRETAINFFNINEQKAFIIPHASDPINKPNSLERIKGLPQKYLVSAGSIVERKRPLLLAQMAKKAGVPIVFIGTGNENDEYFTEFKGLVDNKYVYYLGYVSQETKIDILSQSNGFALLSTAESGCIAVYEAASLGLPLFLADALWAKCYSEPKEIYFCDCKNFDLAVTYLQDFYSKAERKEYSTFKVHTWEEIASMYKVVYQGLV